ncbi:MAG: M3 family metallopeptidase [Gemmatimonadaceae bacterium]
MSASRFILPAALLAAATTAKAQATPAAWQLPAASVAANCRASVARAKSTVNGLLAAPGGARTFATVIKPVENALGTMNNEVSAYGFMFYVSPDKAVRDSSNLCNQAVTNYSVEVTADPRLYRAAEQASREKLATVADRQLVTLYLQNGRHGGAALDSATRVRTTALLQHIADLGREYAMTLGEDSSSIRISDAESAGLPSQFLAGLKHDSSGYVVPTNESTIGLFVRNAKSSDARHRYLMTYGNRGGMGNIQRLRSAVAIRDTLAHLFGFPTWAAYQLDVKVAKTPQRVISFLDQIDAGLLPKAREEVARLSPIAAQDTLGHTVEAWDVSYYNEQLRRTKYALDAEAVRQYFPVDHVVRSVEDIYQELFGLKFTEVKPADAWSPEVTRYAVTDAQTGRPLGTIYLDLFPRAGKYDHFADFSLRAARALPDGSRELPVTAIVGNWPQPGGDTPALLSHGDVVTFFHEFGHAVDALADQSPYISTGTGYLRQDFVEALSQMLENWMWQPSILKRVSRNVKTGEPLPDSLIARMLALKHFSDGGNGTAQAFYSAYDMTLHSSGADVDPVALWNSMEPKLTAGPVLTGVIPAAAFGHLMSGYDAGYYGYLWSKVYAQDLFTRFATEGIMNPKVGRAYRTIILAPGATEEPDALLQRFLGRPLSYDAFFAEMGISSGAASRASALR